MFFSFTAVSEHKALLQFVASCFVGFFLLSTFITQGFFLLSAPKQELLVSHVGIIKTSVVPAKKEIHLIHMLFYCEKYFSLFLWKTYFDVKVISDIQLCLEKHLFCSKIRLHRTNVPLIASFSTSESVNYQPPSCLPLCVV